MPNNLRWVNGNIVMTTVDERDYIGSAITMMRICVEESLELS